MSTLDFANESKVYIVHIFDDGDIGGVGHSYPANTGSGVQF